MVFLSITESSPWLSGILDAEVDDAWDNSQTGSFETLLYLAAKPSHVRVGVDRLACPLHHPTTYHCQTRGHGLTLGVDLSYHGYRRWHLLGGVRLLGRRYLMES
jgi:hypothetical protein